jgi:hypothetical protein
VATFKKRSDFFDSEEGVDIREQLRLMTTDNKYNTTSTFSTNNELYPDNLIPFVDKHMNYLNVHPKLDATQYLANIRLMTRVR